VGESNEKGKLNIRTVNMYIVHSTYQRYCYCYYYESY